METENDLPEQKLAELLTVVEAAAVLRCSPSNVYGLVARGLLKAFRVGVGGAGLRFSTAQLQAFLEQSETRGREEPPTPGRTAFKTLDGARLKEAWKNR